MSNPATSCPHYFAPGQVAGQPSYCRGCGALIATPNPVSPEIVAGYPGKEGATDGLAFPTNGSIVFGPVGTDGALRFPGSGGSNAGLMSRHNPQGAALSEVS
jgi:hypothetical protein